jgi:hypothetical protein
VDAHALLQRHAQETERVRVAQIRLRRERKLRQRLELDAEAVPQPVPLEPLQLGTRECLHLRLEDHRAID